VTATLGSTPVRPARLPRPSRAGRVRLAICLAVVVAALGWIAVRGLTGGLVYYLSPTEAVTQHQATDGHRIRVGAYVVPGTVGHRAGSLTFDVTDGRTTMHVVSTGAVPEMFRTGQGVVLEGAMSSDGRFHSDTLLVKHDGNYRPPSGTGIAPGGAAAAGSRP
jgi:cytochrome c-type biogenesis protein CcmE